MDLHSTTTVVAAFMAGLGLGSLLGGAIADRVKPIGALSAYAVCEAGIGSFALVSIWLLYGHYPQVSSGFATFAVNFTLLLIPTTLMGMTLPIISRGVVEKSASIGAQVGRLYAINTVGASLGAAATAGWWLLGHLGLEGMVRLAAGLNLGAGVLAMALVPVARRLRAEASPIAEPPRPAGRWMGKPIHWVLLYGVTGFISLSLEMVWFRLLNVMLASNTYTFARLLTVYLVFLGLGAWAGARLLRRVRRPDFVFLWLQLAIGVAAAVGGLAAVNIARLFSQDTLLYLAPLLVLPVPTFLMGLAFPLVQRMVADNFDVLGKRVASVIFSNTLGSVIGTIVTGFVLLDVLGTPTTLRLLVAVLGTFGVAAAWLGPRDRQRPAQVVAVLVMAAGAVTLVPRSQEFWAPLHPPEYTDLEVAEDGSCVTATAFGHAIPGIPATSPTQHFLFINGELQNGVPFDDFHIRLGTVPSLMHPAPKDVLVIGLGAGSTPFGLSLDPRVRSIDLVEICGTEIPLLKALRAKGSSELAHLFDDPRLHMYVDDGRKFLLETSKRYDLLITDTLVTSSAYSGSLYSLEFYQLARSRLQPTGLFAQWIPSWRTLQTAAAAFPHVAMVYSQARAWPRFMVASQSPIPNDLAAVKQAFAAVYRDRMRPEALPPLEAFVDEMIVEPVKRDPQQFPEVNQDLFPRDEFGRF